MKFSDIPGSLTLWGTSFMTTIAVVSAVWVWVSYLHTDAEAQVHIQEYEGYKVQQYAADKFDRIDRVEREIARIDFQLLSEDLSPKEREFLKNKRLDLMAKIQCIREDKC